MNLKNGQAMGNKKTAVEWLYNQITFNGLDDPDGDIFKQAKAMEKEQMIKFALHLHNVDMSKTGTDILIDEAEQYYNETYNKQDNEQ